MLPKGNYSLVLNGTEILDITTTYFWFYNSDVSPNHPELYTSYYDKTPLTPWKDVQQGSPFLYKLYQKTNTSYNPNDINMTAEVDGTKYNITDGANPYTGNLTIPNVNYSPGHNYLHIHIYNNRSLQLNFTIDYNIKIRNIFFSDGSVLVDETLDNIWTVNPEITRYYSNYSVKFEYSESWDNLSVFKNTDNLTDDVVFIGNSFTILNENITNGAEWKINATSLKIPFNLNVPKNDYDPNQDITFFLEAPVLPGNYTYILKDARGIEVHREIKEDPNVDTPFTYVLSSNPHAGEWEALVFWNNETDAGIQSQNFQVSGTSIDDGVDDPGDGGGKDDIADDMSEVSASTLDPILILILLIIAGIVSASSYTSYIIVKRYRRIREERIQKLRNKFIDVLSLNYLMIIEKNTGLSVYDQFFTGKIFDSTLVSGFLEAIRAFGIELTGTYEQSQTVKLEYKDSKILMSEFRNFRIILILKENPSDDFIVSVRSLCYDIDNEYGELLQKFIGQLSQFVGIKKLIEKHLAVSFISPLKVVETKDIKLTPTERSILYQTKDIMKQNNLEYFFTTYLMPDEKFEPKKIKTIFSLIDKGIFQPTDLDSGD